MTLFTITVPYGIHKGRDVDATTEALYMSEEQVDALMSGLSPAAEKATFQCVCLQVALRLLEPNSKAVALGVLSEAAARQRATLLTNAVMRSLTPDA